MKNHDPHFIPDHEFEALLQGALPEAPPEEIAQKVNPFRKAAFYSLAGLALTTVKLEFWGLQYILTTLGFILMLLGFRALRKENRGFAACYWLAWLRTALHFSSILLNATVYRDAMEHPLPAAISTIAALVMLIAFWLGVDRLQDQTGTARFSSAAAALVVWYIILCILAALQLSGIVILIIMVAIYGCLLYSLYRLFRQIADAGYAVHPALVRISNGWFAAILILLLAIGLTLGHFFFGSLPMEWSTDAADEPAEVQAIRQELEQLGFPADVLKDVTAEDLKTCAGATEVTVETRSYAAENSYPYAEDAPQNLIITGVAVQLPGEYQTWRYFHHFRWTENPGFHGTEAIRVVMDEACIMAENPATSALQDFTGRLLYTQNGKTYTAPFYSLERPNYYRSAIATFSLPRGGSDHRGYLTYAAFANETGKILLSSWFDYVHQKDGWIYPTVFANELLGEWISMEDGFVVVSDPLQINLEE